MPASPIEDIRVPIVARPGTVDEVQELVGRTEEILDTLKELDDSSYERLRRKLNAIVSSVRDRLVDDDGSQRQGSNPRAYRMMSFGALSVAALSGFVIGLLAGRALARMGSMVQVSRR